MTMPGVFVEVCSHKFLIEFVIEARFTSQETLLENLTIIFLHGNHGNHGTMGPSNPLPFRHGSAEVTRDSLASHVVWDRCPTRWTAVIRCADAQPGEILQIAEGSKGSIVVKC